MIDIGQGYPVVIVPGLQGRWEWMRPAVRAVSRCARAISYSLYGGPGSPGDGDRPVAFESFTAQLDQLLDRLRLDRAALCGVSLGGLIALHYAALHPARVAALVLVSTPGPGWRPDARAARYVNHPVVYAPAFALRSPLRMWPEIVSAHPSLVASLRFSALHLSRILAAPVSPSRMAERVRLAGAVDFHADCARIRTPTLVLTGEPALDRVVPVASTREYIGEIPGARGAVLERTGHIGLVTRPDLFARIVTGFVQSIPDHGMTTE